MLDQSVARIRKAVDAEPEKAELHRIQGLVEMMTGDLEAAETSFRHSVDLDPDDPEGYEQLAYFYRTTGQIEKTIATYQSALQASPGNARLHHFLGVLYELDGKRDLAIEHYSKAVENDKTLGEAMNNLAYLLAEGGLDLDRALDLAQEAKELLPNSPNAADTLGWVLFKRGVPSAAVGYLREAEGGMDPDDEGIGIIRHHLAQAYEANGEPEKAVASLEKAIADLERQAQVIRERGGEPKEPAWARDARSMLERLRTASG